MCRVPSLSRILRCVSQTLFLGVTLKSGTLSLTCSNTNASQCGNLAGRSALRRLVSRWVVFERSSGATGAPGTAVIPWNIPTGHLSVSAGRMKMLFLQFFYCSTLPLVARTISCVVFLGHVCWAVYGMHQFNSKSSVCAKSLLYRSIHYELSIASISLLGTLITSASLAASYKLSRLSPSFMAAACYATFRRLLWWVTPLKSQNVRTL
ncbi:hypothetical protein PSPO01_11609 [Paraphaeosphaeria sporulosa]